MSEQCPLCPASFPTWPERASHLRDDHGWIGGVVRTLKDHGLKPQEIETVIASSSRVALRYERSCAQQDHVAYSDPQRSE